jgi:phenylalanyl-tRNA synthetase alpha chain
MITCIDHPALLRALNLRDLTDPLLGPHAMQQLTGDIHAALARHWRCPRLIHRGSPLVPIADNYDALGYAAAAAARDARYTRYVSDACMLRSQMSAVMPALLRGLALDPPEDVLLVCPGIVYRRDTIDRLHVGEPHQLDLWRIARQDLSETDLHDMIARVVQAALPGTEYRTAAADHPYTTHGRQIDVCVGAAWVEIGECGLAAPNVLARAGLNPPVTGLAMGLGLDRLLMLRKGIDDIRLLRADDTRIVTQMQDLGPYLPVSRQPAICRDLSVAVDASVTAEEQGDRVREAMGDRLDELESLDILSETPWHQLPEAAHQRLGIKPGQKNVLLRLTIRHPVRSLTSIEANTLRNRVYAALHEGDNLLWANE